MSGIFLSPFLAFDFSVPPCQDMGFEPSPILHVMKHTEMIADDYDSMNAIQNRYRSCSQKVYDSLSESGQVTINGSYSGLDRVGRL